MASLSIFAGPTALNRIRDEGLNADQFKVLLAASGGPKWFVLYGLDRYLFGKFFAGRETELITLGSSAGAWRISCLGTSEPVAAIERLARLYSREDYSSQPTTAEITDKARAMLSAVLGADGAEQIINNAFIKTHIITDRCKGFGSSPAKPAQILFLILSAVANLLSRRNLSVFFERTVFSNMGQLSPWASLPYGKIPDRSDFKKLDYPSCIDYWQQVLDSSQLLADEFSALVDSGHGIECIQPFEQRRS